MKIGPWDFFVRFLRSNWPLHSMALAFSAIFYLFVWIYNLPQAALLYCLGLFLLIYLSCLAGAYCREARLLSWFSDYYVVGGHLPEDLAKNLGNLDLSILQALVDEWKELEKLRNDLYQDQQDYKDYFALWLHRIKTPLAVLRLQVDRSGDGGNLLVLRKLGEIERYAKLALTYVNLKDPNRSLDWARFDMAKLLESMLESLSEYANLEAVDLVLDLEPTLVISDRLRLSLALEQFIVNACKFGHGGQVKLSLKQAVLTITDQGPGIPDHILPLIQNRGYAGAEGDLIYKSSGLGLYLADRLLAQLGLEYEILSEKGQGCEIRVDFSKISGISDENVSLKD